MSDQEKTTTQKAKEATQETAKTLWQKTKDTASNPVVAAVVGTAVGIASTLLAQGFMSSDS